MSTKQSSSKLYKYIASAGSGKTFAIAREYIRLALASDNPFTFRTIQAVTFTNKATEEMKTRILDQLHKLAQGLESDMRAMLIKQLGITEEKLQERAKRSLEAMLLGYADIRVSTIDAFFQDILRAFARELNLSGSFRVELESALVLKEACRALLIDEQYVRESTVLKWITGIARRGLERGSSYNPLPEIERIASQLLRDEVRSSYQSVEGDGYSFPSLAEVETLEIGLGRRLEAILREAQSRAKSIRALVEPALSAGYAPKGGATRGPLNVFAKIEQCKSPNELKKLNFISTSLSKLVAEPEKELFKKGDEGAYSYIDMPRLAAELTEVLSFFGGIKAELVSLSAIHELLPMLGLLSLIDGKVKNIQKSNNSLLLADAPSLIHRLLHDEAGVHFLYERIGTSINHLMIDEFQDTSLMQYQNFLPLLDEIFANSDREEDSVIVGDVKQSIYRWRGSDSSLLERIGKEGGRPYQIETKQLGTNWRSSRAVVHFNNALYPALATFLKDAYDSTLKGIGIEPTYTELDPELFTRNYADIVQKLKPNASEGRVCLHRYRFEPINEEELESYEELSEESEEMGEASFIGEIPTRMAYQLPRQIELLVARGYRLGDIAILVRTRAEASYVARILQRDERQFDFISNEALAPTEALSVGLLISALSYMINPEEEERRIEFSALYSEMQPSEPSPEELEAELSALREVGSKSLYEMLELLASRYKAYIDAGELPYVIKLLDTALSYQQDLSLDAKDFLDMWAERGHDLRLVMPENRDKLQIMTIHKSKGLSFPVVLLPFLHWEIQPNPRKNTILWCNNPLSERESEGLASPTSIPKVPIQLKTELIDSDFAEDFLYEAQQVSLDALNTLYVATTRAEEEMHIWLAVYEDDNKAAKTKLFDSERSKLPAIPKSVTSLLMHFLPEGGAGEHALSTQLYRALTLDEEDDCDTPYTQRSGEDKESKRLNLEELESYELDGRIEELREGIGHFDREQRRHFGTLMHAILSEIETADDALPALERAVARGDLRESERAEAEERLRLLLSEPVARPWFDGSGEVLTERAILSAGSAVRRPDRVLLYPDGSAVVVDYKFGKPRQSYARQILDYARLLQAMGYSPVRAYLWYLGEESHVEGKAEL